MRVFRSRILAAMGLGAHALLAAACGSTARNENGENSASAGGASATNAGSGTATEGQGGTTNTSVGGASAASSSGNTTTTAGAAATSMGGASATSGSEGSTSAAGASAASVGGASAGSGGSASSSGAGGAATSAGGAGGTNPGEFCQPWPQCATVRRPFLVGADLRSARSAVRGDWLASGLEEAEVAHQRTREFLAEAWLKDALEEHASIAAFARFTMLLLSVGAPPELIVASQRASLDEVKHARDCFALAKRYGSAATGPDSLDLDGAVLPLSLAQLVDLAVEEGCVGETLGALLAREQRELARDAEAARVLARLERDEARHAELAWKFLAWAVRHGGPEVRDAAERAFTRATQAIAAMPVVDYGVDLDQWHAHGRVTCAEARALSQKALDEVVWPCWRALSEQLRSAPAGEAARHA